jgi:hypothetical protein
MDYMRILLHLGVICLLSRESSSKRLIEGTFFADTRLTLMGKLVSLVLSNWKKLALYRFVENPFVFYTWLEQKASEYMTQEAAIHFAYHQQIENMFYVVFTYTKYAPPLYLYVYYDFTPARIINIMQQIDYNKYGNTIFPCRHSIVIFGESTSDDIYPIIQEVRQKINKKENTVVSVLNKIKTGR